ncbi:MAG: Aspartyl-tRNA synthetase, archaeal type [Candidatus Adlerbacteria bacterium GW2011_GWA1_54_10]|uniref:Aspartyl-tRNA synthetase, archaeal type n=1 Tax=Candidatus Adlerbacteria bacterium GW2011_GWA1_54_10 TaxID=1618605 RepID=A0A0G1XXH8_9BACT|nr:MAG: Aspartyl-tRNA synthetase, archaeal type [Candidatus Adlerbacteria bacterium GW2011_GWA1_54_10]
MPRTLIADLNKKIGEHVKVSGWVSVRRDQGKMVFFDLRDRSGMVQGVVLPNEEIAMAVAKDVRAEYVVSASGIVNKRPEKNINQGIMNGNLELQIQALEILAESEIPFELGSEVNLDTYLDHLPYTLRSQRAKDIFKVQETIITAFRASLHSQDFTEFQAPALTGGDAEGGAAAFEVKYLYDQKAFLATSPQFYKQIMVGSFERVFSTPQVFRGEKHATTRHLTEYTSLDFEMGFIQDHRDVMQVLENAMRAVVLAVGENHQSALARFDTSLPLLPNGKFPSVKLVEAQNILGVSHEPDLEPEHERALCDWSAKEHGSDFIFVTHYPISKRPFYTCEDEEDTQLRRAGGAYQSQKP